MAHYSRFDGKWPVERSLSLSEADSTNGYSLKNWEVQTISGIDTSIVEIFEY